MTSRQSGLLISGIIRPEKGNPCKRSVASNNLLTNKEAISTESLAIYSAIDSTSSRAEGAQIT
jgi:hypothetical protein